MPYLEYSVVNGQITKGSSDTVTPNCIFQQDGNIWSLDGPTLGFLCSIVVTFVNVSVGRIDYDPRVIGSYDGNIKLTDWGWAEKQSDGRFAIRLA